MRRFNTVTKPVVVAAPDRDGTALTRAITTAAVRPTQGGRGVIGLDRGDPSRTFAGPVPVAPSPATALAKVTAPAASIPYTPPALQDAALADGALGSLAVIQYNRIANR